MFRAQTRSLHGQAWKGSAPSSRLLTGSSRYGHTRPTFATRYPTGQTLGKRGFRFSPWRRNVGSGGKAEDTQSLGQKFRKLSKEYGKAAVVVYFMLSILDYPFFFLLVRAVGTDRVAKVEHFVVSTITSVVPEPIRVQIRGMWEAAKDWVQEKMGKKTEQKVEMVGWGVEEAQERHDEEASLGTQMALAYAIHKSFIFVRIPLTAAVTPRVVKTLRSWGWNIGKPVRKSKSP